MQTELSNPSIEKQFIGILLIILGLFIIGLNLQRSSFEEAQLSILFCERINETCRFSQQSPIKNKTLEFTLNSLREAHLEKTAFLLGEGSRINFGIEEEIFNFTKAFDSDEAHQHSLKAKINSFLRNEQIPELKLEEDNRYLILSTLKNLLIGLCLILCGCRFLMKRKKTNIEAIDILARQYKENFPKK